MARAHWGSRLGFILAATGSAVGLGAIWKFPYVAARQGGGAFLLLFIALTFVIGLALLRVEMAVGRGGRGGAFGAYRNLGGPLWAGVGLIGVVASFIVLSFYGVVGGWTIAYVVQTATAPLSADPDTLLRNFDALAQHAWHPLIYHALFMLATLVGVVGGVQGGIEKLSKILMPALFVMMLVLVARGLMLPGAQEGVARLLIPDFGQLGIQAFLDALGLSFWTLSLGMGIMVTYGSYLTDETNLDSAARTVAWLTVLSCVMGALLVLPPAYAMNLGETAGPGLTFVTMPIVFANMPFGNVFGTVFFLLLFVAALTSSVSMFEVSVAFLMEQFGLSRKAAAWLAVSALFLVGAVASLSLGARPWLQFGGRNVFDWLDWLATNLLLPLGGILAGLFAAWRVWPALTKQWYGTSPARAVLWMRRLLVGVLAPAAIGVILWHGL